MFRPWLFWRAWILAVAFQGQNAYLYSPYTSPAPASLLDVFYPPVQILCPTLLWSLPSFSPTLLRPLFAPSSTICEGASKQSRTSLGHGWAKARQKGRKRVGKYPLIGRTGSNILFNCLATVVGNNPINEEHSTCGVLFVYKAVRPAKASLSARLSYTSYQQPYSHAHH